MSSFVIIFTINQFYSNNQLPFTISSNVTLTPIPNLQLTPTQTPITPPITSQKTQTTNQRHPLALLHQPKPHPRHQHPTLTLQLLTIENTSPHITGF